MDQNHPSPTPEDYSWTTGGDRRFRHIKPLDRGGFGWVHKLEDTRSKTYFARKLIQSLGAAREWENEKRAVEKLCHVNAHPNIVALLRTGELPSSGAPIYYLDMELCDLNLASYISRDWTKADRRKVMTFVDIEQLPLNFQLDQISGIMKDVASGLAFIHSRREVHRDLKPKNILYSWENDAWKIADFGYTVQGSSTAANTDNGRGTLGYRAPEVVTKNTFSSRSDIWTLGCIWFEIMCREQAFASDYEVAEFSRAAGRKYVPRDNNLWNDDMEALLHKILQINPANRPSASELVDLFAAVFRDAVDSVKPLVQKTWEEMFYDENKEPSVATQVVQLPEDSEDRGEPGMEDHVLPRDQPDSLWEEGNTDETSPEESDTWNFEYATQIIVNSSNTFFAALVTLRSEPHGNSSCEQLQLRETYNGTVVWRWRHVTPNMPETNFGPDGRYFCFYDGQNLSVVDTTSHSFRKTQLMSLPSESEVSTDLSDFEWNLRYRGLRSFAINNDATRVAVALLDSNLREIRLDYEINQSGGLAKHVDQISIPASANGGQNKITMRYIASTHALFVVWENNEGVIVESFLPRTSQQLCHIVCPWNIPRDWDDPIRIYGTIRVHDMAIHDLYHGFHDCLVLSVPAKVHRKVAGGRFLPTVPGRKIVAISMYGDQMSELRSFSGRTSLQPHDIILSNDQDILFCLWNRENILMQKWHNGSFRKLNFLSIPAPRLHSRGYRCAFLGSRLTMFSPQGDLHCVELTERAEAFQF